MSPRAAWRLEAEGFREVYDFVPGKVAWLAAGLPTEGTGPHYAVAGEVASPEVPTCSFDSRTAAARERMERAGSSYCVVVNDAGIILGRVRARDLGTGDAPVRDVMQPGPATVRPTAELKPLVARMHKANVTTILVASEKGRLLGVVDRSRAEALLRDPPIGRPLL